ncbi:hypothetical conserved protein [Oceanobacillus iheyensis HTE831]|uniref:Hypothetical conserved protein n=1 Tax=Oceanobacillus iheyensis (strain DSM 14371 / CIP 107618 / JCM 11309 / KCTC 3954 / HTE831) TaxID=221109 RepID=Q8ELL8_OCEIH|nr:amidohydrolase/deacetylase family metallohydrolase [Oceanobacillus iheyensis]BAC15161.1 hypothetical conserved protein [Oceanobacillus iheyensis HTE831]
MVQIVKNATLVNGTTVDIVIENQRIVEASETTTIQGDVIVDAAGMYVSPGWIDLHTHAFPKYKPYCAMPDQIGYKTGVTTVVDAGSSGADDVDEFYRIAQEATTRVFAFLNISRIGLMRQDELSDLDNLSFAAIQQAVEEYPQFIVGLKARMSASVVCGNGIQPLSIAETFRHKLELPLMVHVGTAPPELNEVLSYMKKGDILTHCYHEKENNHIFREDGSVEPSLLAAIDRGVYLDVGHGSSSFSFGIAQKAKQQGVYFDSLGTDIYQNNQKNGPVYNMETMLSKFLALGYSLEEVIEAVTIKPAEILRKPDLGSLQPGSIADLTFFTVKESSKKLTDSFGTSIDGELLIKAEAVIIGGKYFELEKSD